MNSNSDAPTIDLQLLGEGMPGLTRACGTSLAESAAVCLEHRSHSIGATVAFDGIENRIFSLVWSPVDDQQRRCYNDMQEATERGASAIAIALVKFVTGKVVIERSRKGSGFDYWLGDNDDEDLMNGKTRLEVSGILSGDHRSISKRIREKRGQIEITDGLAPGLVGVIEFSGPVARVERK